MFLPIKYLTFKNIPKHCFEESGQNQIIFCKVDQQFWNGWDNNTAIPEQGSFRCDLIGCDQD